MVIQSFFLPPLRRSAAITFQSECDSTPAVSVITDSLQPGFILSLTCIKCCLIGSNGGGQQFWQRQRNTQPAGNARRAVGQHLAQCILCTFPSLPLHASDQLRGLHRRMSAPSVSSSRLAPPQTPLICLTTLSDHAQPGVRVSTYWVHRRCQVLQRARQPCQGQRILQ